jgi:hypothetical protein
MNYAIKLLEERIAHHQKEINLAHDYKGHSSSIADLQSAIDILQGEVIAEYEGTVRLLIEGDEDDCYLAGGYLEGKKNMYLNEILTPHQMGELENQKVRISISKIKE